MIIQLDGVGTWDSVLSPVLLMYVEQVEREGRIRAYRVVGKSLAVIFRDDPEQVRLEHATGNDVIWANPNIVLTEDLACAGDMMRIHVGTLPEFAEIDIPIYRCSPVSAIAIIKKELGL